MWLFIKQGTPVSHSVIAVGLHSIVSVRVARSPWTQVKGIKLLSTEDLVTRQSLL